MTKIHIVLLAVLITSARPALCDGVRAEDRTPARWFGKTAADLSAPGEAAGSPDYAKASSGRPDYAKASSGRPDYAKASSGGPLKVKARFVRELTGEMAVRSRGKAPGRRLSFLVVAEGGEIRCEMGALAKGAGTIRDMKRATPMVIYGAFDARRKVFMVDSIVQGWGRDQMGDDS